MEANLYSVPAAARIRALKEPTDNGESRECTGCVRYYEGGGNSTCFACSRYDQTKTKTDWYEERNF